jgi:hypothetical protein
MGGLACDSGRSTTTFLRPDHDHLRFCLQRAGAPGSEAEASSALGAERHERSDHRRVHRNGSRDDWVPSICKESRDWHRTLASRRPRR